MHNNYKIIQKLLFKIVLDKAYYTTQHFMNFPNDFKYYLYLKNTADNNSADNK